MTLNTQIGKFEEAVTPDGGPLQKIIHSMHRRQVPTYDKNGKAALKEYLTYRMDYHGHDWVGNGNTNEVWIRDHIHRIFTKPRFTKVVELNPKTGSHIVKKVYDGTKTEYYFQLPDNAKDRRQIVEDIINSSN